MELRSDLKIILQNVNTWTKNRGNELSNYYNREQPDVILINDIGTNSNVKILNYNVHVKNFQNEQYAAVAIAVRRDIRYQILDSFIDYILGIRILTLRGPINILTHYSPPRQNYLPIGELNQKLNSNEAVYLMGDLNAHHPIFGYRYTDLKGQEINNLINRNIVPHLGPEFPTIMATKTKADVVLGNRHAFYNIAITEGEITTSDHLPIMVTLLTKAIIKDFVKRNKFKNADWDKYKSIIDRKIEAEINNEPLEGERLNQEKIDTIITNWIKIVNEAKDECVPKTKVNYYIHPKVSDYIKLLEQNYKQFMTLNNWNRNHLNQIRNTQEQLKEVLD